MNKFIIIAILALSYVSAQRYRCMDKLDGSPAGKCLVVDYIGIYYVSSCKTGKVCDYVEDEVAGYGQCTNFKLPGFDGQACSNNEECLSNNCDGTKCAEKVSGFNGDVGICINDLACEKGKFCNEDGYCEALRSGECEFSNQCKPYHVCNFNEAGEGTCVKVGTLNSGTPVNIYDLPDEYKGLVCKGGYVNSDGKCDRITKDDDIKYTGGDYEMTVSLEFGLTGNAVETVDFRTNVLTGAPYPEWNKKKSDAMSKYISEVNDNERDDDDGVWAFGLNRLTGDKKKVKEALIKYIYPELYDDEDDDEIECVRKYMQQITLSSKSINISKYLLLLVALFL